MGGMFGGGGGGSAARNVQSEFDQVNQANAQNRAADQQRIQQMNMQAQSQQSQQSQQDFMQQQQAFSTQQATTQNAANILKPAVNNQQVAGGFFGAPSATYGSYLGNGSGARNTFLGN